MFDELRNAVLGAGIGGSVPAGDEGGFGIESICVQVADHCLSGASSCSTKASTCTVSHGAVCDNGAGLAAICTTQGASCPVLASTDTMPC